jgi:enamine deaminase RidA (YjgF/YER057c/UK114 family)
VYIGSEFVLFAVVKTTVLLADISDFAAVNEVYKQCKLRYNFNGKAT